MPHDISFKTLQTFLNKVQWNKVVQKAPNTPRGQRLFPSRTPKNDTNYNFRIDKGSDIDGKPELIIQANKNAADKKVKEAAQNDSHAILAKGTVDPKIDTDGSLLKQVLPGIRKEHASLYRRLLRLYS
ncbi:hypothetical protein BU23DRAFT_645003 [Bimuria novae-zelandiae CBS 107.79]|uniref:Uncharacterized protein n=1 Tax=Bimuria novae-zelandiae CBS 107.79 TaxID=1447943 RepID=A0A6A5VFV6_9PLEO|nr:hypothetical protein BU23DRAFT_645003 [Bimuria novae-zelandiae CBS 107.79]